MSDPLNEIRESIQETAEADLPAFQRLQRLRAMRAELAAAVEHTDAAIGVVQEARDAERVGLDLVILALRERAETSEGLIADGVMSEAEVSAAGILSNAELDELDEEGLLEATARELIDAGTLNEAGEWTLPAE